MRKNDIAKERRSSEILARGEFERWEIDYNISLLLYNEIKKKLAIFVKKGLIAKKKFVGPTLYLTSSF